MIIDFNVVFPTSFRDGWKKRSTIKTKVFSRRANTGKNISVFCDDTKVMLMSTFNGLRGKRNGEKNFQKVHSDSFQNTLFISIRQRRGKTILRFQMMRRHTISWQIMRRQWICG
jgi:hypothetical protein